MKKLSLFTFILSQIFLYAMEDPNADSYGESQNQTGLGGMPTEVLAEIQSHLDPDSAHKLSQTSRRFKDVHDEHYWTYNKEKVIYHGIDAIISHAIQAGSLERARSIFSKTVNQSPEVYMPDTLDKLNNPDLLRNMYTPERVFKQFEGKDIPVDVLLQRFNSHLQNKYALFADLEIHFYPKDSSYLSLSNLGIRYLSPEIGKLTKLEFLYLSKNQLTSLPQEIENLTLLDKLILSHNQLTFIPPEIHELKNLCTLSFEQNRNLTLTLESAKALLQLTQLKVIDLSDTQIPKNLRKCIWVWKDKEKFKHRLESYINQEKARLNQKKRCSLSNQLLIQMEKALRILKRS